MIVIFIGDVTPAFAIDNEWIYRFYLNEEGEVRTIWDVPDNTEFEGNIVIPPENDPNWELADLPEGTYTIEFAPGVDVTFEAGCSITIQVTEYGEDLGTGRIDASGTEAGPVVFGSEAGEPAAGDWDKISILTTPTEAQGSNILDHCEIMHGGDDADDNNNVLFVGGGGWATIEYCIVRNCGEEDDPAMEAVDAIVNLDGDALVSFHANEIRNNIGIGLWVDVIDEESEAISHNLIHHNTVGVVLHGFPNEFNNNLAYRNEGNEIVFINIVAAAVVRNNLAFDETDPLVNDDIGISGSGWPDEMLNNIVVGNSTGISYEGGEEVEATFCDVFNCDVARFDNVVEGEGCINADPEFADEINADFHLQMEWDGGVLSNPCVDTGELDPLNLDPDGTRADMGAYGGSNSADYDWDDWAPRLAPPIAEVVDLRLAPPPPPPPPAAPFGPVEYFIAEDMEFNAENFLQVEDSVIFRNADGVRWVFDGAIEAIGSSSCMIEWKAHTSNGWDGIYFNSDTNTDSTKLQYVKISGAEHGIKLTGVTDSGSDRLDIENCTIDSCGTGIYATNSRVEITNSTISNCGEGTNTYGIYLNSCSAGKVIIDNNTIEDNGVSGTYTSAGIYLDSSSPEIVNNTIENNTGCGIACLGSTPDLNTYDSGGNEINNIHANGSGTQTGSSGAEIYLASSSYPTIKYNNIWDFGTGPVGIMIYKDEISNSNAVYATDCWWGCSTPADSFFYWGLGTAIDYSSYSSTKLSSFEEYELAMGYWDEGEYEDAAYYFRRTILDDGAIGINSVHYLAGCVGEMEDGNFITLRSFLQDVADEHEDEEVAKVADRFATHCLTEILEYEDAMDEYDLARRDAGCLRDSVEAVIDYLAVCELSGEDGDLDASLGDIPTQMHNMMELLQERTEDGVTEILLPRDFMIIEAYPNPFNSTTTIAYNLSMSGTVKLTIHDLRGREVAMLQDGMQTAGYRKVTWEAGDQPSGFYLCRLESVNKVATTKLTLIK